MESDLEVWKIGDPYCMHCGQLIETTLHVMRDCPLALVVWLNVVKIEYRLQFFRERERERLDDHLLREEGRRAGCGG